MISLNTLAQKLTEMLNGDYSASAGEYANVSAYGLDEVLPNVTYRFYVTDEEGDFKYNHMSSEDVNLEIRYINAVLTVNSSTNEGVGDEDYVGTMETTLDVLVPDLYIKDDGGTSVLPRIVRQLLTDVLQFNQSTVQSVAQEINGDDTDYLVGIDYNIPTTGTAAVRHQVAGSLTLAVYIDFTFVTNGIASTSMRFYFMNDEGEFSRLYATQYGIARKSTLESNTGTESEKNAVTNEVDNTVMTINGNLAVRNIDFCRKAFAYVINEVIEPMTVKVEIYSSPTQTAPIAQNTFAMIFAECGLNGEPPYAASMSFVLVEAPEEVAS